MLTLAWRRTVEQRVQPPPRTQVSAPQRLACGELLRDSTPGTISAPAKAALKEKP
jgi:hypothetical protein